MQKKLLIMCFFVSVCLLTACYPRGQVNESIAYCLEKSDSEITKQKGDGTAQTYLRDGNTYVISRCYNEEIFGLPCKTEYIYSDDQKVSQVVTEFIETNRDVIMSAAVNVLGEPSELQPETAETQFKAVWQKDSFSYTLIQQPATPIYMIILRQ
ncbi:MAG: hypothetical protein GX541_06680 [Clostridiales bacterium]|nr:hypothetical protein [Clostridiales bacterium]